MARFEVSIPEMYNAASKIHQAAEDYLTAACKVYALSEMLGESWEGDSQVAFMEEQRKAAEWFKKMAALVESYVQMIQRIAKAYQEADEQATSSIRDGGWASNFGLNWARIQAPMVMTLYAAPNSIKF